MKNGVEIFSVLKQKERLIFSTHSDYPRIFGCTESIRSTEIKICPLNAQCWRLINEYNRI